MNQSNCLILIVLVCGIAQIYCNKGVVRDQWQDAADELDVLKATASNLLNISGLQVARTSILLTQISQETITMTKDEISVKTDLALLDINEWKELTLSFGLEPPIECVTGQEAALRDMSTSYMHSIESCGNSILTSPTGQINGVITSINRLKSIIDNLYSQFYACGQDATCLNLLYPEISSAGQYNTQIRDQLFSIEEIVGSFPEYIDTGCSKAIIAALKQSQSGVLVNSKECLQNAITTLH